MVHNLSLSQHINRGCRERDLYEYELRERVLENRKTAAAHITNNTNTIVINMPQMRAFGQENVDYILINNNNFSNPF